MTNEDAIKHIDAMIVNAKIVRGIVPDEYDVEALVKAIEALEANEWIPCDERLPGDSGTYLTTTAKGSVCTDHYYANSVGARHWSYYRRREPIAWMRLPSAYKEKK